MEVLNKSKLIVKDLYKKFDNKDILKTISFDVKEGEFLSVLGPSGCGKTTLLRILIGLETQTSGTILMDGEDISHLKPDERGMGIIFQNYALFPNMTVLENVEYALKLHEQTKKDSRKIALSTLEAIGMHDQINKRPNQLSGGQQQRVAIARTLALNPKIVLLDEPISALDVSMREIMKKELKEIQKKFNSTMIFITHEQEEAFYLSDRIMVMSEGNIEQIVQTLEKHQIQLLKEIALLDKMYDLNTTYFKELSMYILAGKKKLNEVRGTELPALMDKAHKTGLPEDAQAVNDMASLCNRFEKKIHDLELTRMISIQMAPQIRLVQNNDTLMSEKIQSTIVNTIPLWKSQMVLAIGINHSEQAARAQREVTDMTNELLRKNAEVLKTATIETAKESERGIVDMETLKITNESLITTLDEVVRIQTEGRQKRREAETELARMEGELKQKLLQLSN